MSLASRLSDADNVTALECLRAAVEAPFFEDGELHTLSGYTPTEIQAVLNAWPEAPANVDQAAVLYGVVSGLTAYTMGFPVTWPRFISVSQDDLRSFLGRVAPLCRDH